MITPAKNRICLWYDGDAEEAARFCAATFPDPSVGAEKDARHRVSRKSTVRYDRPTASSSESPERE